MRYIATARLFVMRAAGSRLFVDFNADPGHQEHI